MKTKSLFILAVGFFAVSFVLAQDVEPPAWRTNDAPGLTFQAWEFLSATNPCPPDLVSNVFGDPSGDIMTGTFTNNLPNPEIGGPPVSGWHFPYMDNGIAIFIPNDRLDRPSKLIRIQITSTKSPANIGINPVPSANLISNTYSMAWQHGGTPWYTYVYDYLVQPNPSEETIVINFPADTIVEEIVVDTWCLPEPGIFVVMLFTICFFSRKI